MATTRPLNADIVALLNVAIAILAEEMNVAGAKILPRSKGTRHKMATNLQIVARDAAVLAGAAEVLNRRPELLAEIADRL
jgi:hypothetical protein